MNYAIPEDIEAARDRVRPTTMAAEDLLHEMGAISIINSDSQGMGRIAETIRRTWQLADANKQRTTDAHAIEGGHDNDRIRQYIAKYTINPARTHGMARHIGSLEPGKLADIVLWRPEFFGAKPETVIKGGVVAWTLHGEGNASISRVEPVIYDGAWGAKGSVPGRTSAHFVSHLALQSGLSERLRSNRMLLPVENCRALGKSDLVLNETTPDLRVDPLTAQVFVGDEELLTPPVEQLALNRRYFLS